LAGLFCATLEKIDHKPLPALTFKKKERLCSKKIIDALFTEGSSFLCYPVKVVWMYAELPTGSNAQAAFTVSKKLFRGAVQRNRIKRRMREAYRLNKHLLTNLSDKHQVALFFILISKAEPEYKQVETAIGKAIKKLNKLISEQNDDRQYQPTVEKAE
jgi:ribonuclease P protein component